MADDHYAPIIQFLEMGVALEEISMSQKKQLVVKASNFQLITGHLYKMGPDEILWRCVLLHEQEKTLEEPHASIAGGHYGGQGTTQKVLPAGLWWSTLHNYVPDYAQSYNVYQRIRKPSR